MEVRLHRFRLTKAVPLTISRGTTAVVTHLLLRLHHEGITGCGETGGFDAGLRHHGVDAIASELEALRPRLESMAPQPLQALEALLEPLSPPARCAVDLALHDWWGRRLGVPVGALWGLDPARGPATSVTLGLGTVDQVVERLRQWW